ncbi:MAG: YbfB/YjiJ family MFS transporter, partial [Pseudorhodobacter sp.]|nr:YbfB/YjiJ family MFS transporter [Rhizobacter sp.]
MAKPVATFWVASGLALGAAISLGLARFAYALLLPPMRADLGWNYFTAGAMNTANAAGYLLGALMTPMLLRSWGARRLMLTACVATAVLLAAHGAASADATLLALRLLTG